MEKNISIHFRDEELPLLEEFEKWRRDQYFTRSAFVKQCMHKALKENNPRRFAWTGWFVRNGIAMQQEKKKGKSYKKFSNECKSKTKQDWSAW